VKTFFIKLKRRITDKEEIKKKNRLLEVVFR